MAQEYSRIQRVGDYLKRELALLIQQEVRDPRVGMVNINEVEVSRDLAHAKVYVTFVSDRTDEERAQGLKALNNAGGFLRSKIAASNHMRTTPRLFFVFDTSIQRGAQLTALIDKAVAADASHHAAAQASEGQ
ncbi:MAG TPA: 30S ribosome-binding factor RbfA [Pseudomonadales bacterium]|nr:30S ribosome-binding factor RbfA [Pseudomonadales bacterium]